jgi:uncharacterized membrane protein
MLARHPAAGRLWAVAETAQAVVELRGFGYLRDLVRRPGQRLAALELVGAGTGVVAQSGLGETLDRQALGAFRARLRDLDDELVEAETWADTGRLATLREERQALLEQLARETGLGGRPRMTGSSQERARVAVKKAITTAVDRIATVDEPLARHLRSSIHTGLSRSYDPEPSDRVDWVLA